MAIHCGDGLCTHLRALQHTRHEKRNSALQSSASSERVLSTLAAAAVSLYSAKHLQRQSVSDALKVPREAHGELVFAVPGELQVHEPANRW